MAAAQKATLLQALSRNKGLERQEMWKMRREEDKGSKHKLSLKSNKGDVLSLAIVPQNASVTKNGINKYDKERAKIAAQKETNFLNRMCDGHNHTWRPDAFFSQELGKRDVPWPVRPMECFSNTNFAEEIVAAYEASRVLRKKKQKKKDKKETKCKKKDKRAKKEKKRQKEGKTRKKDKKLPKARESFENIDSSASGPPVNFEKPEGMVSHSAWGARNSSAPDPTAPTSKRSWSVASSSSGYPDAELSLTPLPSSDELQPGGADCQSSSEGPGPDEADCESSSDGSHPDDGECESSAEGSHPGELHCNSLSECSGESINSQASGRSQAEAARWVPDDVISICDVVSDAGLDGSVADSDCSSASEEEPESQSS